MRWAPTAGGALAVLLIAAQGLRSTPTNPPVEGDVSAPPEVQHILRRACYDCHSNETRWPWYHTIAPLSWLMQRDVKRGRARLNFSQWSAYASDPGTVAEKLEKIARLVSRGEMAPWSYQLLHPSARLSPPQRQTVCDWAIQEARSQQAGQ
jgi:hypothetical protein